MEYIYQERKKLETRLLNWRNRDAKSYAMIFVVPKGNLPLSLVQVGHG